MATRHRWHHVNETERRKWQDPEEVLKKIGLQPGMTFLDIGCGEGFFTLPAARMVGPEGCVYGVDIDGEAIEQLSQKAAKAKLKNVQLRVSSAEEALLCWHCADIIFFGIVLHDFQNAGQVLENARKMLKNEGKLVNLDWKKIEMDFGPPVERRFFEAGAARMIERAGFNVETIDNSGQYFYLITARPA